MRRPERAGAAPTNLSDVIDTLLERSEGQEKISVGDVLDAFGRRAFGPLILIPALLLTLPTGALPGVPLVLGALIALVSLEMLAGRRRPAIPSLFCRMRFSRAGLQQSRQKISWLLDAVDNLIEPRLTLFVRPPLLQLGALTCIALTLLLIPTEVIPFATALPGAALILIGLAITAEDGLAMVFGIAATILAGFIVWCLIFQ